ncbi:conserved hypothetical protein [Ricinus communis]|uniref:Uncharacterized protein n=1 Tax=Ricinus communis TaxID=3988 RepID=B9RLC8_RICCO|nr:conserved hypothetical protein [Ricinus communis]
MPQLAFLSASRQGNKQQPMQVTQQAFSGADKLAGSCTRSDLSPGNLWFTLNKSKAFTLPFGIAERRVMRQDKVVAQ